MIDTVHGKCRPTMAASFPSLAINIEKQHTAEDPCHSAYHFADEQLNHNEKLLFNSIITAPMKMQQEIVKGDFTAKEEAVNGETLLHLEKPAKGKEAPK